MLQMLKQRPVADHPLRMMLQRRSDASYGQADYLSQKSVMSLPTSPESNQHYTHGGTSNVHLCDPPPKGQQHFYFEQQLQQQQQQQQSQPIRIEPLIDNLEIKKEDTSQDPEEATILDPCYKQGQSRDYRIKDEITGFNKDLDLAKQTSNYISQDRNQSCKIPPEYFDYRKTTRTEGSLQNHPRDEIDYRRYRGSATLDSIYPHPSSQKPSFMHDVSSQQEEFTGAADQQPISNQAEAFKMTNNEPNIKEESSGSQYDVHTGGRPSDPPDGIVLYKSDGSTDISSRRASLQNFSGEKKTGMTSDCDPLRLKSPGEEQSPKGSPTEGGAPQQSDSGIVNDGGSNTSTNSGSTGVDHDDSGTLRNMDPKLPADSAFKFEGPNPSLDDLKASVELSSTCMPPESSAHASGDSPTLDEEEEKDDEEEEDEEEEGDHEAGQKRPVYPPLPSFSGTGMPIGQPLYQDSQARPSGPSHLPGSAPASPPFTSPGSGMNLTSSPRQLMPSPVTPNSSQSRSPPDLPQQPPFDNGKEVYFCHLCSYVGTSKFHFNQHMNSHFEHRCPHCDYTSRTEGRLKRHIKDFHSEVPPENYSGNRTIRTQPPRPKVYKCKQCDFVSITKVDFWEHSRSHIKEDKVLQCPKCPFVTEYKHHLEYHLRNHFGSKPFKCPKCNYSCVNKSMLNSHMKSHTNVYQYRCADCTYATKYCHSLKLHLKKYIHKPATVLNADGSLPTDGSGDFELVSKRGPPRGPRGPRRDKSPQPMVNPMMMPQVGMNGLHPPINGGMMGPGFWPMMGQMPNGLHPPPPLIPVSGANPTHPGHLNPGLPLHLQMVQHQEQEQQKQQQKQQHSEGRKSADNPSGPLTPVEAGDSVKCTLCDFATDSRGSLSHHMLKVHAAENQDLFNMFGIPAESLSEDSISQKNGGENVRPEVSETAATPIKQEGVPPPSQASPAPANSAWVMNTNQPSAQRSSPSESFPSPLFRSTPHGAVVPSAMELMHHHMIKERYNAVVAAEIASNIEAEAKLNGECPLDLTKRKNQLELAASQMFLPPEMIQYHLSQKRRFDEMTAMAAMAAVGGVNPNRDQSPPQLEEMVQTPRKRSRKGKAYKLDTICQKLQERYGDSPTPDSNEEDTSDSTGQRSERRDWQHGPLRPQLQESQSRQGQYKNGGDSDSNGDQIDYNEIHNSLRDLNRQSVQVGSGNAHEQPSGADELPRESISSTFSGTMNRRKLLMVRHKREQSAREEASILNGQQRPRSQPTNYEAQMEEEVNTPKQPRPSSAYECSHCEISFKDCIMYTMHMGYHGYQDPFKCNMCGHTSKNRVEFFLHIARAAHE